MTVRRIVWPGHVVDPVLWAESDGAAHWVSGFGAGFGDAGAGAALGPYPFREWHGALMDAMRWAYQPHDVPDGWRVA